MDLSKRNSSGGGLPWLWIILAFVAILAGGFLIATLTPGLLPREASTQATEVDWLFSILLGMGGAVFLLVQGALVFSVIRFRARKGDTSDGLPVHGNSTLEIVWTIIPAGMVLVIVFFSFVVFNNTRAEMPNEQNVGVSAARFAWSFTYNVTPDDFPAGVQVSQLDPAVQDDINADGSIQIVHNQLHTYVGQPVKTDMVSQDVIHSFWIPDMRVKQDVLPGRTTEIRFTPTLAGSFRVVCAELCGSGHGIMAGEILHEDGQPYLQGAWVIVHDDEDAYRRDFLEPQLASILFPPEDPALRGRQVIQTYICNTCHTLSDLGWTAVLGPNLDGIGSRTQRLDATGAQTMEEYIHNSIRHPQDYIVPGFGPLMPPFNPEPDQPNYMPEADLEAIVAYLLTQTND